MDTLLHQLWSTADDEQMGRREMVCLHHCIVDHAETSAVRKVDGESAQGCHQCLGHRSSATLVVNQIWLGWPNKSPLSEMNESESITEDVGN